MAAIELANRSGMRLPLRRIARTTRRALAALGRRGRRTPERRTMVVAFVPDGESRRLARRFLKKSGPADVLSFDYGTATELVLAPKFIRAQARRSGTPFLGAVERLIAHGALHLAGYHHERSHRQARRFDQLERRLLTYLKIPNPNFQTTNKSQ